MDVDLQIERRMVIGVIVSTEYVREVKKMYFPQAVRSGMAKRLLRWSLEYFDKYNEAPGSEIENVFTQKLKEGLPKEIAEEIEEDILPELSQEYERGVFNLPYLLDQTREYFKSRRLSLHTEKVNALMQDGELEEAEKTLLSYTPIVDSVDNRLILGTDESLDRLTNAFHQSKQTLVRYSGALGSIWNDQMVRDGFVALLGPEKRGKTYLLMDIAIRGCSQGSNVVFFQAGDMTEAQQLRRIGIYLCQRSDKQRYCGTQYKPVLDCVLHQNDSCERPERETATAPFEGEDQATIHRKEFKELKDALSDYPEHEPCHNCSELIGTVWLQEFVVEEPLQPTLATHTLREFFRPKFVSRKRGKFLLSTHANGTLSASGMLRLLESWEKSDGFVADIIVTDYADILAPDAGGSDFRQSQNQIWGSLRRISQEKHCLMVTATQADADSYDRETLHLKNFSEDKRKYAHVTAMYGLNQDPKGRERKIGLLRINELVVREDEVDYARKVAILQRLQIGRPYLGSFFI